MSLQVRNTKSLITRENFRMKVLCYGIPGVGKSEWLSGAPELGIAACETGLGKGLLTIAGKNIDFVEPSNVPEFEAIANGQIFKDKKSIGLDSLSYMNKSFIRDAALSIPRRGAETGKRAQGVPELDDYQVMAEMTRRITAKLLDQDKHVIVTATEKYTGPDAETGQGETLILPDLPGAMALTCTAMFDFVFRLRTRQKLRDPKDPKSRYVERYFITQPDGQGTIAKCRSNLLGIPFLDKEEVFDLNDGRGSFMYMLNKILAQYPEGIKDAEEGSKA